MMILVGLVVTFLGFIISVASLGMTSSVEGRMVAVLLGIVVSLVGIIGVLGRYYSSKAIWRK
ncbi:MAG TPA: hypothetical protein VGN17_27015 [Bryobacteraceae bacterium]|jgi:hypothetical protein